MNIFRIFSTQSHKVLEDKLLKFFIASSIIWAVINASLDTLVGMPPITVLAFIAFFIGSAVFYYLIFHTDFSSLFKNMYIVASIIYTPILWYVCGGGKSSASILYVSELILLVMCLKHKKQKVFTLVQLFLAGAIQGISQRWPHPVYPMEQRQYAVGGAVLGLSTCILIAALLYKQKREYTKERDAALASEKELAASNALQKNFLANMSHEIRSPLGIVLGFNNLIRESDDISQIHEYAHDISQAGTTLLTVINDILDYSKIESGKLDIIDDNYSLETMISEIEKDIRLKCDEKGLRFTIEIDEKVPKVLYGDNIRIKQCLLNVLSNAVKYTEKGLIIFCIDCRKNADDDTYVIEYMIRDTGKGISEEALPHLYSAFKRLDESSNRTIEGTGLGLAITKNLLDQMNGTIDVKTKLGQGTTFIITLPQKLGVLDTTSKEAAITDLSDVRVLVVDDMVMNLILVKKLLEKDNAIVSTIDNGEECLEDIKKNKYDIILLDHMMPGMNGIEVFEKIKEQPGANAGTPIAALTANAMSGAASEYLKLGFDAYISKPIAVNELRETVYRLTKM